MKIQIGLIDSDLLYRDRFMVEWENKRKDPLELHWFSSWEECIASPKFSSIHFILLNEALLKTISLSTDMSRKRFILWDVAHSEEGIRKYQSVTEIHRRILHAVSQDMEPFPHETKEGSLVLFTSSQGGIGTSSIAQAISIVIASHHPEKNIFYMEFEPFGKSESGFNETGRAETKALTIADVILAMRLPHANVPLRMEACMYRRQQVRMFQAPLRAADFFEITAKEWSQLFTYLKESESVILLDCASSYLGIFSEIRSCVDHTVYVGNENCVDPEGWMQSLSMPWTPGKDVFLSRDAKRDQSIGVWCVPYLSSPQIPSRSRSDMVHAIQQERNIQEVASWILA